MEINTIYQGDVIEGLKSMEDESVQMCVTSPPYWGLRDYSLEPVVWSDGWTGHLGLEPTPEQYIHHLVEVFREVRRVMRKDGTLWLNMGDGYAGQHIRYEGKEKKWQHGIVKSRESEPALGAASNIKPKQLIGMPWRLALALQADGWWLRSDIIEEVELYCPCGCGYVLEERIWRYSPDRDIIWHKPNPMPESVTDRPTKSHEYIFLLTKSAKYYYDGDAIREPAKDWGNKR